MVNRNICSFFECNAIKFGSQTKNATDYARQFKVRTEHIGIIVEELFLQFLTVICKIPGLQFKVIAFNLACLGCNGFHFVLGLWQIIINQFIEQMINCCRGLCHAAFQGIVSISVVTQKLRQFATKVYQSAYNIEVIVCIAVRTTGMICPIKFLTILSVICIHHERTKAGSV